MNTPRSYMLLLALAFGGCKGKPKIDVDAINALVATKHVPKLHFVQRAITSGIPGKHEVHYVAALPDKWPLDDGFIAKSNDAMYGDSSMSVTSSCEAEPCVPGDWNAVIDKELAKTLLKVERDDREPNRRTVVAREPTKPTVVVIEAYWWLPGAKEYHQCSAHLDEQVADSAAAFEKACKSVVAIP